MSNNMDEQQIKHFILCFLDAIIKAFEYMDANCQHGMAFCVKVHGICMLIVGMDLEPLISTTQAPIRKY